MAMAIVDAAAGILAFGRHELDRAVSPDARSRVYDRVSNFAASRPILFTFVVSQTLTSLLPFAIFLAFTSSVLILSVGAALLFSLFWLGVALLFLIPTLFVTVSLGFLVFVWAMAARFAWAALPASLKATVTPSSEPSHRSSKKHPSGRDGVVEYRSSSSSRNPSTSGGGANGRGNLGSSTSSLAAAPPPPLATSTHQAETNGAGEHGPGGSVVDLLEKIKAEKDGDVTE